MNTQYLWTLPIRHFDELRSIKDTIFFCLVSFNCEQFEDKDFGSRCKGGTKLEFLADSKEVSWIECRLKCIEYGSLHGDGCCESHAMFEIDHNSQITTKPGICSYRVGGEDIHDQPEPYKIVRCNKGIIIFYDSCSTK